MKRILSLILVLVMMFSLASCGGTLGEQGDVSVVIENRDGSYTVYKAYLEEVMKNGAETASYVARRTLSKVQKKLGFVQIGR